MDEEPLETDITPSSDGIYATCGICFAIVAHDIGHEAWHASRGEVVQDAHD